MHGLDLMFSYCVRRLIIRETILLRSMPGHFIILIKRMPKNGGFGHIFFIELILMSQCIVLLYARDYITSTLSYFAPWSGTVLIEVLIQDLAYSTFPRLIFESSQEGLMDCTGGISLAHVLRGCVTHNFSA